MSYREIPLATDGGLDWAAIEAGVLRPETRVVLIQRSRGYAMRPTLTVAQLGRAIATLKAQVGSHSAAQRPRRSLQRAVLASCASLPFA